MKVQKTRIIALLATTLLVACNGGNQSPASSGQRLFETETTQVSQEQQPPNGHEFSRNFTVTTSIVDRKMLIAIRGDYSRNETPKTCYHIPLGGDIQGPEIGFRFSVHRAGSDGAIDPQPMGGNFAPISTPMDDELWCDDDYYMPELPSGKYFLKVSAKSSVDSEWVEFQNHLIAVSSIWQSVENISFSSIESYGSNWAVFKKQANLNPGDGCEIAIVDTTTDYIVKTTTLDQNGIRNANVKIGNCDFNWDDNLRLEVGHKYEVRLCVLPPAMDGQEARLHCTERRAISRATIHVESNRST